MNVFQAIVYGIVQGITEFLPVSSTAHLTLMPWILGWKDPGVAFDVAVHLGTAAAVILFFIKDSARLIRSGFTAPKSQDGKLFWFVVVATIPGALFGVLLDKYMSDVRNPVLIGVMLILMGIVLYFADKLGKNETFLENMNGRKSLIIGMSQVLAIIPGVSRSGITMSTGRILGINRESIAKFTFLISAPIILGDGLYHVVFHAKDIMNVSLAPFLTAVVTAAVVGALCIKFLLNYLKTKGFAIFALYRFVFGTFVIILFFVRTAG